jgi:hypothetical protein
MRSPLDLFRFLFLFTQSIQDNMPSAFIFNECENETRRRAVFFFSYPATQSRMLDKSQDFAHKPMTSPKVFTQSNTICSSVTDGFGKWKNFTISHDRPDVRRRKDDCDRSEVYESDGRDGSSAVANARSFIV